MWLSKQDILSPRAQFEASPSLSTGGADLSILLDCCEARFSVFRTLFIQKEEGPDVVEPLTIIPLAARYDQSRGVATARVLQYQCKVPGMCTVKSDRGGKWRLSRIHFADNSSGMLGLEWICQARIA